jgi:DNA helicase HerA-like ATPase
MPSALWKIKPALDNPSAGIWLGPGGLAQTDGLWLGNLAEVVSGRTPKVWLTTGKEQVIAVVGKRGSGKSFTLGVIAEGLSLRIPQQHVARQSRPRAALLFDPLDVYWTTRFPVGPSENLEANRHYEIARAAELSGLEFNVEAWVPGTANQRPSDPEWFRSLQLPVPELGLEEWEILLEANVLTEPMGQALADALNLVRLNGYRRRGATILPINPFDINNIIDAVQSDDLSGTYHPETLRALRQRLTSLEATGLFSAVGTSIPALISPGQLTVVLLGRLPQSYRSAVVAVITRMLIDNRGNAAFAEKRLALDPSLTEADRRNLEEIAHRGAPRTVVALDEAQSFLAPGVHGPARDLFVRLVKEGRNIGLSAMLATQQPSAIDQRILSQVETFIAHQLVTEADIKAVRDNLKSTLPDGIEFGRQTLDVAGLLRQLPPGQCLVSSADMNTTVRRSLVINVRPRATVHGGIEL